MPNADKLYTGIVKFYNHKNKFGFIIVDETKDEIFVAEKDLKNEINESDKVQFKIAKGRKSLKALEVSLLK